MYFVQLKSLQIILLTLSTLLANSPISILLVLFLSLILRDHYYLNTILSITASILPYLLTKDLWFLIPIILNLYICYELRKRQSEKSEKSGIKPLFLIFLGLTSMNYEYWVGTVQLGFFYLMLALDYLDERSKFVFLVKVYRVLLPIGAIYLSSAQFLQLNQETQDSNGLVVKNQEWWYYLAFTLGTLYASLISNDDKAIQNEFQREQSEDIQLQQIKSNSKNNQLSRGSEEFKQQNDRQYDKQLKRPPLLQKSSYSQLSFENEYVQEEEINENFEKQDEKLDEQRKQASQHIKVEKQKQRQEGLTDSSRLNKEQSESLNLLIVIPFCLVGKGWTQFPLYLYLLSLQWNFHHKTIAILMLFTAYLSTINWGIDGAQSIFLRILASLLVSKEIRGVAVLGQMIRSFWLRASFALVLIILFWFSLLTVNVFHLTFIIVVLLFVVKNEPQYTHSYRHRNWKYLQLLFNIFLILRQILHIATYYQYKPTEKLLQILDLAGISYAYTGVDQLFNLVPLLINSAIALQYLTYTSDIYDKAASRQSLLSTYKQLFRPLVSIVTIIYYKLLPWVSYIVVLGLPALLDFSLSSWILLAWGLTMFAVHILGKHDLPNYKRMHFCWLGYLRLTAIQIVLRFTFEFVKFDLFAFIQNYPLFQYLVRYQQLFGLAIPRQETVYFKTISKFQVMVSLDLSAIFISFLVQQYYLLLIKYLELPAQNQLQSQQDKNVAETYNKYINFKLTNWLNDFPVYRRVLIIGCNAVLQLYFPILGLLACQFYSIQFGLYLAIALLYYLKINLAYYQSHVKNNLMQKVLIATIEWQKGKLGTFGELTRKQIDKANKFMQKYKVKWHQNFRFWVVLLTLSSILLTHLSKALQKATTIEILGADNVLNLRWWLYLGGCSVEIGYIAHFTKLMLVFLVLQRKCCWFINRLQTIQEASPEQQEQELAEQALMRKQRTSQNEPELRMPTYFEQRQSQYVLEYDEEFMRRAKQNEIVSMRVSILFGQVKLLQRSLVMVLVFASLVEVSHPFGIFYLLCAILLNYLGSLSIKTLSKILFIIILAEYFLLLCNYTNHQLYSKLPTQFIRFQEQTFLHRLFNLTFEWQQYITFGKKGNQLLVMSVSWILMFIYPFYFRILRKASINALQLLQKDFVLGPIAQKLVEYIQQIYSYGLSYSPLVIMLLCLWIYLLDYTVTNLILTALTIGFIFLSFLVRDYKDSRQFWRTYFIVLQLIIVCFMVIYMLLQIPMLAIYCTKHLCSSQPIRAQFFKALLLLILQLGLDITHSHHFNTALDRLQHSKIRTGFQKLAIAQRHNDRKILAHFKRFRQEKEVESTLAQIEQFLKQYKQNPQMQFDGSSQNYETKETWFDLVLDFLPQIVDQYLLLSQSQIKKIVLQQNEKWRKLRGISQQDIDINDTYIDYFAELDQKALFQQLQNIITQLEYKAPMKRSSRSRMASHALTERQEILEEYGQRKSYMRQQLPLQSPELIKSMQINMNENKNQKNQLLYLLLVESIYSNWHYISYVVIILLHIRNLGLLTFLLPVVVFGFGLVSNQRAGKLVWRVLLILVTIPLLFKFCVQTELINLDEEWIFLLIGDNLNSTLLEYLAVVCIIGQCIILKLMGHWDETSQEIQCMKMALIRNIINNNRPEERQYLFQLLKQSKSIPTSFSDMIFGRSELKPGYDYSTLLTSLQLGVLVWIFLFYDKMAVKQEVTFYSMLQYNQFSSGMVVLTFIQLIFLLGQRFIAIADLRQWNERWQSGLIFKYALLISNLLMIQILVLLYFPLSSDRYQSNTFVTIMLIINLMGLLVQTLQIKKGLDNASRGFMDRYTWYNGFIYIGYRAVPFLFEFKMFSDWTFTKTALRIFDWIRLQQIFGRLYVAKCNSLFMAGKRLGSKIEWWKKLLMGYPLLLSIILLIFGPLVLFSGLNPLASLNDVTAGYLEVVLKVNHTNQYPLYTNSHITDIHHLNISNYNSNLLASYDIDLETVQELQLQQFSDQYWEISQGSYQKLLTQPQDSLYEMTIRARFDRNQTGLTSLYVLSSTEINGSLIVPLKQALKGNGSFCLQNLVNTWLRLDNNNGLHQLGDEKQEVCLQARAGKRAKKQYWVVEGGLKLRIASDKFTQAIFGYSVMSFYISIILVIANYFRFLFQGSVHTIITSDLPRADPLLAMCNAIFKARRVYDLQKEEVLFWRMIDILRSPDTLKALTGDYLQARLKTLKDKPQ